MKVSERMDVAFGVVDAMVSQNLSLSKACNVVGMTKQSFLRRCEVSPELSDRYERARDSLIDHMADELLELADAPIPTMDNGGTDSGLVRQRQLQIDTRKWFLSKLAPKVYGDRLDVQVSDNRISIKGALEAANARLANVIDITPSAPVHDVHDVQDD